MSILHVAFYPSDWLAGTRGMSDSETGVYITLIARMYEMAGPIERDDERLQRLCGCKTKPAFRKALDYLISEGKIQEVNGLLSNERVQKEIKNVMEKSSKASAAAKSRWDKKSNKNNDRQNANATPEHMRSQCKSECQLEPEPDIDTFANANDGQAVDATDVIWSACKDWLVKQGIRDSQARSVIGKWLSDNSPEDVRQAFNAARTAKTGDPIPYITRVLQPKPDAVAEAFAIRRKANAEK